MTKSNGLSAASSVAARGGEKIQNVPKKKKKKIKKQKKKKKKKKKDPREHLQALKKGIYNSLRRIHNSLRRIYNSLRRIHNSLRIQMWRWPNVAQCSNTQTSRSRKHPHASAPPQKHTYCTATAGKEQFP